MTAARIDEELHSAIARHRQGDIAAAARGYAAILEENPQYADAWHLSGVIALQQNAFTDAKRLIQKALELKPRQPVYLSNLAAVHLAAEQFADAERAARQGLQSDRTNVRCRKHLATALSQLGRHREAAELLDAIVADFPADVAARCNFGAVLVELGRFDEAIVVLDRACELAPRAVEARLNRGRCLHGSGRTQEALAELNIAVQLGPNVPECFVNRGNARLDAGDAAGAIDDFQRAVTLHPQSGVALNGLGRALQQLGYRDEALEALSLACQLDGPLSRYESNRLYCASLSPLISRAELFRLHESWGRAIEQQTERLPVRLYNHERIRVGYISPDFRNHATMRFVLPLLEAHDNTRFDIYCYFEGREDAVSQRVQRACTAWRLTGGLSDAELAVQIQRDEIDLLVDLAGHTAGNRLSVFAAKPAPVQVSGIGYPNTTGLSRIDFFLTDAIRDSETSRNFFTEQPVFLPHGACCFEAPSELPVAPSPHQNNGYITFGSAHRLEKMSPDCLALWGRVLKRVPDSRLLIFRDVLATPAIRTRLLEQLRSNAVDTDRVDMAWELPANHLEIYAQFDILLDVFPWGSGATAYESMWMGVPIPTIAGGRGSCRATASMMHQCGLPELCADSVDEYADLVASLATDLDRLQQLRESIRPAMLHTVCNGRRFAKDIEEAFLTMINDVESVRERCA